MAPERRNPDVATAQVAVDYTIMRVLVESATLEEAAPRILAAIGDSMGWELGGLWEAEPGASTLRCVAIWQGKEIDPEGFEQASRSIRLAPGVGLPGRVWATGQPAILSDVAQEGNFPRSHAVTRAGLHGAFGFPITGASGVLGVIEFFTSGSDQPGPAALETMSAVGRHVGRFVESRRAEDHVRRSEELKSAMLDSAFDCLIAIDQDGKVIEFNPAAERTFGYARDDVIGEEMAELIIPPHLRDRHRRGMQRLHAGGEAPILGKRIELTGMRSDGSEFPIELGVTRIGPADPPMFTGYVRDITERRRSEEALRFLVEASAALDASLDLETTLQTIARLSVPYLADGCMVDLLEEDGSIRRVGAAAADASYEPVLRELQRHPIDPAGPHTIADAIRTGRTQIVHDISDTYRHEIAQTDDYYEALRRWPARSVVVSPLRSRGKSLGTVSLASFTSQRSYGLEQISVIEELSSRAAKAVENALLFRDRARIARGLEQSLLPPQLPVIPGVDLAARFRAAGGGGEVGGDFYDVIEASRGRWAIVMGDVAGRGVEAAALTVLARHTLRAAALREQEPSQVLTLLNEALLAYSTELSVCSALIGFMEVREQGAVLSLASGGHPLPLLLRENGDVQAVGRTGTLLGILRHPDLHDEEVQLQRGEAVVFYTNGVAEIRAGESSFGLEQLTRLVATCRELDAAATAQCIDEAVVDAHATGPPDDAAILVAKIAGGESGE